MDSKSKTGWNYNEAFSRNLGILSDTDQEVLRRSTVAIPGCGGVGGIHAQVLARLGVGGFNLVDFDQYEVANFNRQFGARTDSLGSNKVDVIEADVRNINPDARIRSWSEPLSAANVDAFLEGVDLVVDSLDFFAADARLALFEACERLSIPLITAAPLGFSTALLIFAPGSMSYKKYFNFKDSDTKQQTLLKFAAALAPKGLHFAYLAPGKVDFEAKKGPSTVIGVTMCAAAAAAEGVKLLTGRGKVLTAPHYRQIDPFLGKSVSGKLVGGNRNPVQMIKLWIIEKIFLNRGIKARAAKAALQAQIIQGATISKPILAEAVAVNAAVSDADLITRVTSLIKQANQAPSGYNCQPWSFEFDGENLIIRHNDTRGSHKFNPDNLASHLALGAVVENITLAAPSLNLAVETKILKKAVNNTWALVKIKPINEAVDSDLAPWISRRVTDRRPYHGGELPAAMLNRWKQENTDSSVRLCVAKKPSKDLQKYLEWVETLAWTHADLHADLMKWMRFGSSNKVQDGMPTKTLGIPGPAHNLIRLSKSFNVQKVLNKIGFLMTAKMTLRRNIASSANLLCFVSKKPQSDTLIETGRRAQRTWTELNACGFGVQPISIGAFLAYAKAAGMTSVISEEELANHLQQGLKGFQETFGLEADEVPVWMFRTGKAAPLPETAKAPRLPVETILSTVPKSTPSS